MDFLEDMELYNRAMRNAYFIITKRKTLDDIYYDLEEGRIDTLPLPFDPTTEDGRTEDIIDILDISIRSSIGGGVSYLHHDEETLGPYEKDGWWSDVGPNVSSTPSSRKKVVTLNGPTWKSLDLDWDNGEAEETVIEIKLEKKKDKIEHSGENVVEFKPNDKK